MEPCANLSLTVSEIALVAVALEILALDRAGEEEAKIMQKVMDKLSAGLKTIAAVVFGKCPKCGAVVEVNELNGDNLVSCDNCAYIAEPHIFKAK